MHSPKHKLSTPAFLSLFPEPAGRHLPPSSAIAQPRSGVCRCGRRMPAGRLGKEGENNCGA